MPPKGIRTFEVGSRTVADLGQDQQTTTLFMRERADHKDTVSVPNVPAHFLDHRPYFRGGNLQNLARSEATAYFDYFAKYLGRAMYQMGIATVRLKPCATETLSSPGEVVTEAPLNETLMQYIGIIAQEARAAAEVTAEQE